MSGVWRPRILRRSRMETGTRAPLTIRPALADDKNNFFYGGQPRYEDSRLVSADKPGELVYKAAGLKEVRLTAYYRTVAGQKTLNGVNVVAGHAGGAVGSRHGSGPGHGPDGRLPAPARSRSLRGGSRGVASGQVLLMARPPLGCQRGAPWAKRGSLGIPTKPGRGLILRDYKPQDNPAD